MDNISQEPERANSTVFIAKNTIHVGHDESMSRAFNFKKSQKSVLVVPDLGVSINGGSPKMVGL